jgi:hypothetical protein
MKPMSTQKTTTNAAHDAGQEVTEIRLSSGVGRIWEESPGRFSWAHPDGSEGVRCTSFSEALAELTAADQAEA